MKLAASLLAMLAAPWSHGGGRALLRLLGVFALSVLVFAAGFQVVMTSVEGRDFTWITAVYWTLVTMTTLGFGDIVFESDLGRLYSVVVLLAGAVLILIMLPFTFIQVVYLPWRTAMREARAPRRVATDLHDHLILTGEGPVERALLAWARTTARPYVLIVEDPEHAAELHDDGVEVMVGELDDPATFRSARAGAAAMVVADRNDHRNTNLVFTVREIAERPVIVATAADRAAIDVLELAGADHVLHLGQLLGRTFAARILAPTARSTVVARFGDLVIAEASAFGTALESRRLDELALRERFGVSVVGSLDRGRIRRATADLQVNGSSILLLAGTEQQLAAYDEELGGPDGDGGAEHELVIVLGGGRVGRATARAVRDAGIEVVMVERDPARAARVPGSVVGDAADLAVLRAAGIDRATAVVVTTHDDDTNVFLTLYARRLRPDAEILARVQLERNLSTMHRAGADVVLSYATIGAAEVGNLLVGERTLVIDDQLSVSRLAMPDRLVGRTLAELDLHAQLGCSVIGIVDTDGCTTGIDPREPLPAGVDVIVLADTAALAAFYARYVNGARRPLLAWLRRRGG